MNSSMGSAVPDIASNIAIDGAEFGQALVAARQRSGQRRSKLAKTSGGVFDRDELRDAERGVLPLDRATVRALVALYGCELRDVAPARPPLTVDADTLSAGGCSVSFDADDHTTMLPAYMDLVSQLRGVDGVDELDLRRADLQLVGTFWAEIMMEQVLGQVTDQMSGVVQPA